jgi:ketosteroid isomerase-like protein
MYKATARWMVKRAIRHLNEGDYGPALALFADDGVLCFPGDNRWSGQIRPVELGRDAFVSHRGRAEIEQFLQAYVAERLQMVVDDVLVNGPPWHMRIAVRVHHWAPAEDGTDAYTNRAILFAESKWGKIRRQEDYEDTERVAAFDLRTRATA